MCDILGGRRCNSTGDRTDGSGAVRGCNALYARRLHWACSRLTYTCALGRGQAELAGESRLEVVLLVARNVVAIAAICEPQCSRWNHGDYAAAMRC